MFKGLVYLQTLSSGEEKAINVAQTFGSSCIM